MERKYPLLAAIILCAAVSQAQQFTGLSGNSFATVNMVPVNPSFIVKPGNGIEVNLASASFMAGTNAYSFSKDYFADGTSAGAVEDEDYFKDYRNRKKYLWGNMDILGPAVSFTYKDKYHFGVYTRVRQITRGGNVDKAAFQMLGSVGETVTFPDTVLFEHAGFTTHTFGEIGFTYGRELSNDLNNVLRAGVTVKYLMGIAAGTIYTSSTELARNSADSTNLLKGDITALYSDNFASYVDNDPNNDFDALGSRAGRGSLGFDIGFQYEFHPYADPNNPTPYTFRIAASITDIGSIAYNTDTGSGIYDINIREKANWQFERRQGEDFASYFGRLKSDTLAEQKDSSSVFKLGLPTAFRVNVDWNISSDFWLGINLVLNMRGDNGNVYRPAYVNSLSFTPRYEKGWFMVGFPFSLWGYQTMTVGTVLRAGPLFIGSTSVISTLIAKQIRNLDAYAGLSFKIPPRKPGSIYY